MAATIHHSSCIPIIEEKSTHTVTQSLTPGDNEAPADPNNNVFDETTKIDFYEPFPTDPSLPNEKNPLTLRAVLVGWALGALVNASNVYLGLKIGITNDATMFAVLIGYAVIKLFSRFETLPLIGGIFGPKEHCIIQSVATASGGLADIFIATAPAMFRAGLLTGNAESHYWRFVTLTAACGLFGSAIAVVYRRPFVIDLARDLGLVYPSGAACAQAIQILHVGKTNEANAKRFRVLACVFLAALVWTVVKQYAPGILSNWYPFWWFYVWNGHKGVAVDVLNWGFFQFEWTPLMIGTGMLMPMNASASILLGYVLGYGIIGPSLVARGVAVGRSWSKEYPELMRFTTSASKDWIHAPSPKYWLLWPCIFVSLAASLTDLACHWRSFAKAATSLYSNVTASPRKDRRRFFGRRTQSTSSSASGALSLDKVYDDQSPVSNVRAWEWSALAFLCAIGTCLILGLHWHMNTGTALLTIVLGALLAPVFVISTGQSSFVAGGPVTDLGMLIIAATMLPVSIQTADSAILHVLAGSTVSTLAAVQIMELTTDYKIGMFLNVPVRQQWLAQIIGCALAIFLSPALFIVFAKAYPCILDATAETCAFVVPGAAIRILLPSAIFKGQFVARASWLFGIVAALVTVGLHYLRFWARANGRLTLARCLPNMLMVALGVIIANFQISFAMWLGTILAWTWERKWPGSHMLYLLPVAAGMITGESIGGLVNAVLTIAKVAGPEDYGTTVGCPAGTC